ncbi:MAG: hypothetical protein QM715_02160 [Nibricoccus sp.]
MKKLLALTLTATLSFFLSGCSTYIPPGAKADLATFAPPSIQAGFDTKPSLPFPAGIAIVRIQSPNYDNYNLHRYGGRIGEGKYSVIMTREVEEQSHFDRVSALPQVAGVVMLNRLLIPAQLDGDRQIREAVSRVQADLVFIYTFETTFRDKNTSVPLTTITLGLSHTKKIEISATVSGLLMDTRTGYIYSVYETTDRDEVASSIWKSDEVADETRRKTEKRAFDKLVDEIVASWPRLLQRYEKKA